MNVFILNTGRCGSLTFIKACQHISNYSCAHESRTGLLGHARLQYPDDHIEADNRLSWFLGKLDRKFGNDAIYVHLKRDLDQTAISYSRRLFPGGIIPAYRSGILLFMPDNIPVISVAQDYCDTVNSNIELFLKDKDSKMEFRLENARQDFVIFWKMISAEGDLDAAMNEFNIHHNAS